MGFVRLESVSDGGQPTLMLVDGHSLAFRAFYALPVDSFVTPEGQHTNAIHGFLSMLLSLLKNEKPSHLAVAFDVSRFSFRTRVYPEYKATRGETPPEFIGQVPLLQDALHAMGVQTLTKEDYEADDIIATLAHQGSEQGFKVLVVSGDRDTFQLVNDNVTVLYPSARGVSELKRYTPDAVYERYGIPPERYPDIAALVGETSDNLVGIEKVGEKTAVKWITQYGSLDGVLTHAEEISGVVGQNLRDQKDRAVRNRELNALVTTVELPVGPAELERGRIDSEAVREVFGRLRFRTLTERVLALAGDDGPVATVQTSVAPPAPKALVDEELAGWLGQHPNLLSVVPITSSTGFAVAISDGVECIVVTDTPGSADADPLKSAFGDHAREWLFLHAKSDLHVLSQQGWPQPAVSGCLRLTRWMEHPGRKVDALEDIVESHLAETVSSDGALLPADNDPTLAQRAWWLHRVFPLVWESLPEEQRRVLADIELPLLPILFELERVGIGSDTAALDTLRASLEAQEADFQKAAFEAIGHEVNMGSPKQLQTVLFEELGMPKTRQTKTGYSTDQQALSDLQVSNPHPFLDALLGHRDVSKLRQIVEGLRKAVGEDLRLHTTFDQAGTSTGRLSSLDPNLQNIPARTDVGHAIRRTFVAQDPFEDLLTADYSQIEMRIMAHFSEDEALIEAFHRGEDLHQYVGSQVFDVEPESVTAEQRTKVKAMSYGLAYGLSAYGLARQLGIEPSEAKNLMSDYFQRFGKVRDYLRDVVEQARKLGYTETLFGRRRPFPELTSSNRIAREAAERAALNAPMQGTAADIIKRAMISVDSAVREQGLKSRMLLQVHDELVFEVAAGERETLERLVVEHMSQAAQLRVPLEVQVGFGKNWDDAAH
jgi:DNA polymerase-1